MSKLALVALALVVILSPRGGSADDSGYKRGTGTPIEVLSAQQTTTPQSGSPSPTAMVEQVYSELLDMITDPKFAEKIAKFDKNYFEALKKEGFTEDQALKIVAGGGVPMGK